MALERPTRAGESPVPDNCVPCARDLKYDGTREIPSEAGVTTLQGRISWATDSAEYREGTVKSTLAKGVKQILKLLADKPWEAQANRVPFGV